MGFFGSDSKSESEVTNKQDNLAASEDSSLTSIEVSGDNSSYISPLGVDASNAHKSTINVDLSYVSNTTVESLDDDIVEKAFNYAEQTWDALQVSFADLIGLTEETALINKAIAQSAITDVIDYSGQVNEDVLNYAGDTNADVIKYSEGVNKQVIDLAYDTNKNLLAYNRDVLDYSEETNKVMLEYNQDVLDYSADTNKNLLAYNRDVLDYADAINSKLLTHTQDVLDYSADTNKQMYNLAGDVINSTNKTSQAIIDASHETNEDVIDFSMGILSNVTEKFSDWTDSAISKISSFASGSVQSVKDAYAMATEKDVQLKNNQVTFILGGVVLMGVIGVLAFTRKRN